jgi:hypothetical protein
MQIGQITTPSFRPDGLREWDRCTPIRRILLTYTNYTEVEPTTPSSGFYTIRRIIDAAGALLRVRN